MPSRQPDESQSPPQSPDLPDLDLSEDLSKKPVNKPAPNKPAPPQVPHASGAPHTESANGVLYPASLQDHQGYPIKPQPFGYGFPLPESAPQWQQHTGHQQFPYGQQQYPQPSINPQYLHSNPMQRSVSPATTSSMGFMPSPSPYDQPAQPAHQSPYFSSNSASPAPFAHGSYDEDFSLDGPAEVDTSTPEDDNAGGEPYNKLLYQCLVSAPDYEMQLKDIYDWFKANTEKRWSSNEKAWQNSIRHNLSMNIAFEKGSRSEPMNPKKTMWCLTDQAIRHGIQPTTRYRKNTERLAGRNRGLSSPAPQRQMSGARGGNAARRSARLRMRETAMNRHARHVSAPPARPQSRSWTSSSTPGLTPAITPALSVTRPSPTMGHIPPYNLDSQSANTGDQQAPIYARTGTFILRMTEQTLIDYGRNTNARLLSMDQMAGRPPRRQGDPLISKEFFEHDVRRERYRQGARLQLQQMREQLQQQQQFEQHQLEQQQFEQQQLQQRLLHEQQTQQQQQQLQQIQQQEQPFPQSYDPSFFTDTCNSFVPNTWSYDNYFNQQPQDFSQDQHQNQYQHQHQHQQSSNLSTSLPTTMPYDPAFDYTLPSPAGYADPAAPSITINDSYPQLPSGFVPVASEGSTSVSEEEKDEPKTPDMDEGGDGKWEGGPFFEGMDD